ncbi:hypothetical protein HN388_06725 [bacterium]|jgi:hypothetical protein|nr:hypothetical protein [bacterium]
MKTSKLIIFALTLFMVTGSFNVYADCLTGGMIDTCPGFGWFGYRHDGVRLQQGQTFTVDCLSELQSVAFQIRVSEGGSTGGVPHLQAGDPVLCAIFTTEGEVVADVFGELIHSDGTGWITFDFTIDQTILEVGEYFAAMKTFEDKMASIAFDGIDNGPGYKVVQYDSNPWIHELTADVNHEIVMTQDFVSNEDAGWGKIKSMFR